VGIWFINADIYSDAIGVLAQQANPFAGVIAGSRRHLASVGTSDDAIGFAFRPNDEFNHHGTAAGDRISLMHWQFEGFFVRQLLGALFGYLLYWSGSLWLPIIVHFVFNGLQIVAQYAYFQGAIDIDIDQELELTTSNLVMGAVALIMTLILANYVHRKRQPERLEYEQAMGENL